MLPGHGFEGLFRIRPALPLDSLSTRTISLTSSLPSLTARLSRHPLSLSFFLGRLSHGSLPQPGPHRLHLPCGERTHAVQAPGEPFQRRKGWPCLPGSQTGFAGTKEGSHTAEKNEGFGRCQPETDTVACPACDPGGGTEPLLACVLTGPGGMMIPTFPGRVAARIREDVCKVPGAGAGTCRCSKVVAVRVRDSGPGLQTSQGSVSTLLRGVSRATGSRQSIGGGERKVCLQKTRTFVS